jgi:hypothetical protein
MTDKEEVKRDETTGRRLSPQETRAQDEARGDPADGTIMLTNDSGEVKRVPVAEWDNEAYQAQLLQKGWKEIGAEDKK